MSPQPLSDRIRTLLDEIAQTLAGGGAVEGLLERLETLWLAERPNDRLVWDALLRSLRAQQIPTELVA